MKYQFLQPGWLALVAVPVGLLVFYLVGGLIRPSLHYSNPVIAKVPRKWYTWWKTTAVTILCLVLAALSLLAARPERVISVESESKSVMLVLDVSGSMTATDVAPNRLDAAKSAVKQFISAAPDDMAIGLVVYGAEVQLAVPITTDHASVTRTVEMVGTLPNGTSTGQAVDTALVGMSGQEDGLILLVSDGKEQVPVFEDVIRLPDATAKVVSAGLRLSTIAYGTADGEGDPSLTPDPEALRTSAELTGGQFYEAATAAELNQALASVPVVVDESSVTVPLLSSGAWYAVLVAFGLLAIATLLVVLKA